VYQCPVKNKIPLVVALVEEVLEKSPNPHVVGSLFKLESFAILEENFILL
jgi:hypothetical protein